MDKVFIRDMSLYCIIGAYETERYIPQEILISVELFTNTLRSAKSDHLTDCIDYDALSQSIRALVESAHRYTVEALAEDIARLCLNRSRVKKVIVRLEKPGVIIDAVSVGVEIIRKRGLKWWYL